MSAIPNRPNRRERNPYPNDRWQHDGTSGYITPQQLAESAIAVSRGFVGAVLQSPSSLDTDPDTAAVQTSDLADAWTQDVFEATRFIYQRSPGQTIDIQAVMLWLVQSGRWERHQITNDLAELLTLDPTGAYVSLNAKLVRKTSLLRRMIASGSEIQRLALCPFEAPDPSTENVLAEVSRVFDSLTLDPTANDPATITECIHAGIQDLRDRQDRSQRNGRVSTGLHALDQLVPTFDPGHLIILGARPSVGKTAMATGIATHVSHGMGLPVYFASLEMTRVEIGQRIACQHAQINGQIFRSGSANEDDFAKLNQALELTENNPLFIDDTPGLRVVQIGAAARKIKRRHGLGLVIVDYLQLISPTDRRGDRREQVEQISRDLKRLARELQIPVIALAQLNREVENRSDGRPRLSDLREAGGIEQDADVVLLLWRHPSQSQDSPEQTIGVDVAKQRNGPTGEVSLIYTKRYMRFETLVPKM